MLSVSMALVKWIAASGDNGDNGRQLELHLLENGARRTNTQIWSN